MFRLLQSSINASGRREGVEHAAVSASYAVADALAGRVYRHPRHRGALYAASGSPTPRTPSAFATWACDDSGRRHELQAGKEIERSYQADQRPVGCLT